MSTVAPVARPAQPKRLRMPRRRVGVVGYGAIGAAVGRALAEGRVEGAELVAVVDNLPALNPPVPQIALADAVRVVERLARA